MEVLYLILLLAVCFVAFLAGKSVKTNKAIDRAYPDYKRLKENDIKNQKRK